MTWLEATTWGTISATPELFDEETDSDTAGSKLALEAANILRKAHLGSVYRLRSVHWGIVTLWILLLI
ncbi:LOW QUALITY PROTEIN: hypothetical protein PHPALM_31136 [Phytophthora palmivora]|uniref:Uncharacterized protein n=1 Tax=Phytophthora palmivora TaxID=4796 RepID=A0A2P4X3E4_9STRA|nr:LOW QUALITY PROTEIN: hypothetical protein PHPALM_31136 [Phytophthora palmivora]